MAAPSIERTIHLDGDLALTADEVWRLIATAEGWREWLVDEADIDVREGAAGDVVDDGIRRSVRVESVERGRGISFVWSTNDADDLDTGAGRGTGEVGRVVLQIDETADGRRVLRITETSLGACAECPLRAAGRASRWALRECLLCLTARATSRV